jgi:hypothetical protein
MKARPEKAGNEDLAGEGCRRRHSRRRLASKAWPEKAGDEGLAREGWRRRPGWRRL